MCVRGYSHFLYFKLCLNWGQRLKGQRGVSRPSHPPFDSKYSQLALPHHHTSLIYTLQLTWVLGHSNAHTNKHTLFDLLKRPSQAEIKIIWEFSVVPPSGGDLFHFNIFFPHFRISIAWSLFFFFLPSESYAAVWADYKKRMISGMQFFITRERNEKASRKMKIGQTQCPSSSYGINEFLILLWHLWVSKKEGWMERESLWRQRYATVIHF